MISAKNTNILSLRRIFGPVIIVFTLLLGATACNDKESDDEEITYQEPSSLAITGFKLKADSKILRGLDSVFFTIDLQRAVIYNADSLPRGTKITDLIPVISYSQHINVASLEMTGGEKRTGTTDYIKSPNDSIDFTGNVMLTVGSPTGGTRSYTLKVNVHKQEPDSLCWGETALSALPSRNPAPKEQHTVYVNEQVLSLIQESDGSYTVATTRDPASDSWTHKQVNLSFRPRLRTLTATDDRLYILDSAGKLYTSEDAISWQETSEVWNNITGAYAGTVLGIRSAGPDVKLVSYPAGQEYEMPGNFPIDEYSNMYIYQSKWMAQPIGIIAGGVDATGNTLSTVWAYDGSRWAMLSDNEIPALRGATLIPYFAYLNGKYAWIHNEYNALLLWGGIEKDGSMNHTIHLSYNNGTAWSEAPELMQMPDYIPALWNADNIILSSIKEGSLQSYWKKMPRQALPSWYQVKADVDGYDVTWECPYIYIFGGHDIYGTLSNTVWRGVINRLSYIPIF